jgi:hypothetical protein
VPGTAALTLTGGAGGGGPTNPQNLNRYTYVLNNPIKLNDPTGHCGSNPIDTGSQILSGECYQKGEVIWQNATSLEDKALGGAAMALSVIGSAAIIGAVTMGAAAAASAATGAMLGGTALAVTETTGIGTVAIGAAQNAIVNGIAGAAGAYAGQQATGQPIDGISIALAGGISAATGGLAGAFPSLAGTSLKSGMLNAVAGATQSTLDSVAHGQSPTLSGGLLGGATGFAAGLTSGAMSPRTSYVSPSPSAARMEFANRNLAAANYARNVFAGQVSNAPVARYLPR